MKNKENLPTPLNCMIVEDSLVSREVIIDYIQRHPNLYIKSVFIDGKEALDYLQEQQNIDILFLDIKLPSLNGIEILSSLSKTPYTIFTTGERDCALDAFDLGAVDFLLKPISLERFNIAVFRAIKLINQDNESNKNSNQLSKVINVLKNKKKLTAIEVEICINILLNLTRKEILEKLDIQPSTLKGHLRLIYAKTIDLEKENPENTHGKFQQLTAYLFSQ